jgi:predicted DNA-binding transcriptional regulator YafY
MKGCVMADGFSKSVVERLWNLIVATRKKIKRKNLPEYLGCEERCLISDVGRLKKIGLKVYYSRLRDEYDIDFPDNSSITLKLSDKEFFANYYLLAVMNDGALRDMNRKILLAASVHTNPVYDCGPSYGICNPINSNLEEKLLQLRNAIVDLHKIVLQYCKSDGSDDLILVNPLKLIHTPNSWYLLAWNQKKSAYRKYKLVRIRNLIVTEDKFHKRSFDSKEVFGDSWWLQYDEKRLDNPYEICVRFSGEAGKSVQEYNLHSSQRVEEEKDSVLVYWQMSYLYEFATWLMQWLDSIEILEPQELKDIVEYKIEKYQENTTTDLKEKNTSN